MFKLKLWLNEAKRIRACGRLVKGGLTIEEAILKMNTLYPPSKEQIAYEGKKDIAFRKKEMAKISKILSTPTRSITDLLESHKDKDNALEYLITFLFKHPVTNSILYKYNCSQEGLLNIYRSLCRNGAGIWIGQNWLLVTALSDSEMLEFILKKYNVLEVSDIVYSLIEHLEDNKPLPN